MTLTNANVPDLWIIGLCLGAMIAILTCFGLMILAWAERSSEKDTAQLFELHRRMEEISEPPSTQHGNVA